MGLPKFTAELSLIKSTRVYRGRVLYGNLAATQSGIPANIIPSQFDSSEDLGEADENAFTAEAEDGDFEENGDAEFDNSENGEDPGLDGEDDDIG